MITARVGEIAPDFVLPSVRALDTIERSVQRSDYAGGWLILIFYPHDFTFVCPTELTAFSARHADFRERECQMLGISVDAIDLHREWLQTPADKGGLGPLQFPLASDVDGAVARAYGVWVESERVSTRGLFIIDPDGVLQYSVVHNLSVGRSPDEVLRVLDALRTGGLCPASWTSADGTLDPEQVLQPGIILGHYRIRRRLGSGTFGTVFAAWDMRLERMVALKVLKRDLFGSRAAVFREARIASQLNHPNICTIYAVDEEDGLPIIVMEYLKGQPLCDLIAQGIAQPLAFGVARDVARGLAAAHAQGIAHGDLKPANVILTNDSAPKILDFGLASSQRNPPDALPRDGDLARRVSATDVATNANQIEATTEIPHPAGEPSIIRGTPAYMSPEQAIGQAPTPASDVFAFGLMLIELLTGRPAHEPQPIVELLLRLRDPRLGDRLAAQLEPPFRQLVQSLLAHNPADRPRIDEVVARL